MNKVLRERASELAVVSALAMTWSQATLAQQSDLSAVEISAQQIRDGIYLLMGAGGNLGLLVGEDGVLLIDDELEPLAPKVVAAVDNLAKHPVDFVINTHWHFDHVGGNPTFSAQGAVVIAHEEARRRMQAGQFLPAFQMQIPPAVPAELPVVTFGDAIALHVNGQTVEVVHPAPAHTDGDAMVFMTEANVVHMGDLYWNGMYPLVDAASGGSLKGMIEGVAFALERMDESTAVIPGHGPLSNKAELIAYHAMLKLTQQRLEQLKRQGKSASEAVAAKPTADLDSQWGQGLFDGDTWVRMLYSAM